MQPQTQAQKRTGIFLGVVVILGVLYVNIFWGKPPSIISTSSTDSNLNKTPAAQNPYPQINSASLLPPNTAGTPTPTTPTVSQTPADTNKKPVVASVYNDGTYSATGAYMSPGGQDHIGVTVTLKNDIVTNVSIVEQPGDNTSARYQDKFASGYQSYVLGKNIASVNLTKVSGSSLTPKGFDNALAQIKAQAKA